MNDVQDYFPANRTVEMDTSRPLNIMPGGLLKDLVKDETQKFMDYIHEERGPDACDNLERVMRDINVRTHDIYFTKGLNQSEVDRAHHHQEIESKKVQI